MRIPITSVAVIALAILSGCGTTATPAASPAASNGIVLGQTDADKTVHARVGDTVRVTLEDQFPVPGSALVWNVTSLDPPVLHQTDVTRSTRVPSTPGTHDTYSALFRAIAAGQAVLDVHGTTSCEAMAKLNCPDRDFKITVLITT